MCLVTLHCKRCSKVMSLISCGLHIWVSRLLLKSDQWDVQVLLFCVNVLPKFYIKICNICGKACRSQCRRKWEHDLTSYNHISLALASKVRWLFSPIKKFERVMNLSAALAALWWKYVNKKGVIAHVMGI